ncbi:uncharacterized protein LOC133795730 [Humulus lupulus]|uniref:uncharacterized protein LOC133795730 n=1 Tax=Humulus lupulus TaxID=3486 RepID=UPI002B40494E|nr:uncharacterized protein LOC133795730 [Humulus lupulus]
MAPPQSFSVMKCKGEKECPYYMRYLEHLPFLSRSAAIFRECFDPIVARSGRDLIPVMVYGSIVVSAGLLRIFGREVAELPIVATTREHQGKGYFQVLFSCIEKLLVSLNVENFKNILYTLTNLPGGLPSLLHVFKISAVMTH